MGITDMDVINIRAASQNASSMLLRERYTMVRDSTNLETAGDSTDEHQE